MTRCLAALFLSLVSTAAAPAPAAAQEPGEGERLTLVHCGRCHVIDSRNRWGGIDSTPSFATMRTRPDFEARARAFYTLRPHPAFTQVEGVTPPFDPARPPAIHPVELTEAELGAIVEFALTIPPADLGQPIGLR